MADAIEFTIKGRVPDQATLTRMLDALYAESPPTASWSVAHDGRGEEPGLNVA